MHGTTVLSQLEPDGLDLCKALNCHYLSYHHCSLSQFSLLVATQGRRKGHREDRYV